MRGYNYRGAEMGRFWMGIVIATGVFTPAAAAPCAPAYAGVPAAAELTPAQCRAIESTMMAWAIEDGCEDLRIDFNGTKATLAREMIDGRELRKPGRLYELRMAISKTSVAVLQGARDEEMGEGYHLCDVGRRLFGQDGTRERALLVEK